ncbi:MAG: hypothetical protein KKD77_24205 [Gammaproteobacteria bacterium]|nr:hypothetical protein [Gammaproteobacteria bacterium]
MAITVSRAADLLSVYLQKGGWSQDKISLRLLEELLTIGQRQTAMDILAIARQHKSSLNLLRDLQASASASVETDGYALTGIDTTPGPMLCPDSFIDAECTLDSTLQRCVMRSPDMQGLYQNQYLRGNDEYPVIYFENAKLYIDVDSGSHPVTVTFRYIRQPKDLVKYYASGYTTDHFDIGDEGLETLIIRNAYAEALLMASKFDEHKLIRDDVQQELTKLMNISVTSHRDGTEVGQHRRKVDVA